MSDADAFHLQEMAYLRKEIEYRTAAQAAVERNVVVAVSAIYVALATLNEANLFKPLAPLVIYFWVIPFLVAGAGAARFVDDHYAIRNIASYIGELESRLDPTNGGWQQWREGNPHLRARIPWFIRKLSWAFLVLGTLLAPIAVYLLGL